jgi:hypothetical protein
MVGGAELAYCVVSQTTAPCLWVVLVKFELVNAAVPDEIGLNEGNPDPTLAAHLGDHAVDRIRHATSSR